MSSSSLVRDKFGPSKTDESTTYHVRNYEPSEFVAAVAELEERLHNAGLLLTCTECGERFRIGREHLYGKHGFSDPREDKAIRLCPECDSVQWILHTDLVKLAGVMPDA